MQFLIGLGNFFLFLLRMIVIMVFIFFIAAIIFFILGAVIPNNVIQAIEIFKNVFKIP